MPASSTTSIVITLVAAVGAGPFTISIPSGMTADQFVLQIVRFAGGFWATNGSWYAASQIQSITAS